MLALSVPAFAAENEGSGLQITEERLYEIPGERGAFYYAKIENPTDQPIACGNTIFSAYDANGELLKESKIAAEPFNAVIQPGDYMYLHLNASNDVFKESDIATHEAFSEPTKTSVEVVPHTSEGKLVFDEKSGELNYIEVAITNDTEDMIYDWFIEFGVYDENDELMYTSSVWYDIGLYPNSTMYKRFSMDYNLRKHLAANDIKPARVVTLCRTKK